MPTAGPFAVSLFPGDSRVYGARIPRPREGGLEHDLERDRRGSTIEAGAHVPDRQVPAQTRSVHSHEQDPEVQVPVV